MAPKGRQDQTRDTVPPSFAETTPRVAQPGHDFTLQAVVEMQRSIGELVAKTDRLITDVKSQGDKIDSVRMKLAWIAGATAVVGFLVAVVLAFARLLPFVSAAAK